MTKKRLIFEAASPIMSILAYASLLQHTQNQVFLLNSVRQAIRDFEGKLLKSYPEPVIKIGSYLLCIALDELLIDKLKHFQETQGAHLLPHFHQDSQGKARFFKILNALLETKDFSRELLMIVYFCLSYNYQGAHIALESKLEYFQKKTYLSLDTQRKNKIAQPQAFPPSPTTRSSKKSRGKVLVFLALITVGVYSLFTFLLYQEIYFI